MLMGILFKGGTHFSGWWGKKWVWTPLPSLFSVASPTVGGCQRCWALKGVTWFTSRLIKAIGSKKSTLIKLGLDAHSLIDLLLLLLHSKSGGMGCDKSLCIIAFFPLSKVATLTCLDNDPVSVCSHVSALSGGWQKIRPTVLLCRKSQPFQSLLTRLTSFTTLVNI